MKFLYFLMVQFIFQNLCTEMYFFLGHLAHWSCGWGIPKKRTRKMQLRNIDLRSVRHSNKKLSPRIDFWDFNHFKWWHQVATMCTLCGSQGTDANLRFGNIYVNIDHCFILGLKNFVTCITSPTFMYLLLLSPANNFKKEYRYH